MLNKEELLTQAEKNSAYAQAQFSAAGLTSMGKIEGLDAIMPVPGGKLCLGMECLDRALWDAEPAYDEIKKLGIYSVRIQSGWARTETEEGKYDFTALDREVDALLSRGILPWISLSYGNPIYYEGDASALRAGGIGHVPIHSEKERKAWQQYTAKVVARYRGRIKRYEVWNEPDVSVFFMGEKDWVASYLELLRLTVPVIRENDPNALIIACTGNHRGFAPLLQGGMGEMVDQYSFHNYSAFPEEQTLEGRAAIRAIRDAMAPHLTLIRGEAGCPSYNAPTSFGALHDMSTSETIQAKWASRHLIADFADPAVSETSYFHAYEFLHFTRQHHYYYGALRQDYSRKPVYHVLQRLSRLFDGDTKTAPHCWLRFMGAQKPDGLLVRCCAFERKGLPLFAYWRSEVLVDQSEATLMQAQILPAIHWKCPVLVDTLTGDVYPVKDTDQLPVCGYAMILTEAAALAGLMDERTLTTLLGTANEAKTIENKQYLEG
ncbi:MAG: hypothetical protein E7329_01785 [Clostridiales bacterium]|nr:hypothetical protein [Clostridiales bacterium]